MSTDSQDENTLLNKLIEASTFGLDDLELNRQGRMSGLQRSRLALMAAFCSVVGVLLASLGVGAVWIFLEQAYSIPLSAILLWTFFCAFGSLYWLRKAMPMWSDVRSGTVLCVSGPLRQIYTRVSQGRASMYAIHYKIASKFFDIAFFAPKVIPQNQNCQAYYTPQSEVLVGLEPV